MRQLCYVLFLIVAVVGRQPAMAQKIIEKTVPLTTGQRVFLDLRQASNIRIRGGASGKLILKAAVSINQNKLNDALLLGVEQAGEEVKVSSEFDREMLRAAEPGDCPGGGSYHGDIYMGYGKNGARDQNASRVCAVIDYDITVPAGVGLRVSTLSGNINIAGLTGAIDAKSLSGFVDVAWPAGAGAEVSLKTITGEVYTDQDVAFSNRQNNPIVGYQLRGTLGGSGPLVRLESISNDVYFRKRK